MNPKAISTPTDWRDQIVYFVMIDRFNDGDPTNNDQGADEYDPGDETKYSGGDLRGVTQKLDYVKELGATALWITPPVANQWWDPQVNFSGYHGYWAENFTEVDKHYGDRDAYKALSDGLHEREMLLIQDIVVNHTGNFFHCTEAPAGAEPLCEKNTESKPAAAPTQEPFNHNDPNNPGDQARAIYHFTPPIGDFKDPNQRFNYQLADLDDLNTENPEVVQTLKDSYTHWIREIGVDGFRIDTVLYTPPEMYADFIHSTDPQHPGVNTFAASLGKPTFLSFGETWLSSVPYDDAADRGVAEYIEKDGRPLLDSALNFPLHFDLQNVFAQGRPTRQLAYRLEKAMTIHKDPTRMLNFVDNHDRDRFLAIASSEALKQALIFILTIPGIPVIYYGTEQSFTKPRGSMFANGVGSGGEDHFKTDSEMYRFLQQMTALRREHAVFRRGTPRVLSDNGAGPGVFAYALEHEGQRAVVMFNTSEDRVLLDAPNTGLPEGAELKILAGLSAGEGSLVAGEGGELVRALNPRAALVALAGETVRPLAPKEATVTYDWPANPVFTSNPTIKGTLKGAKALSFVIDGDLNDAVPVTAAEDGSFNAVLPVANMRPEKELVHLLTAYVEDRNLVLSRSEFQVDLQFHEVASLDDPDADDHGPSGTYAYPTDTTYAGRYGDIHKVTVSVAGNNLRFSLKMNDISAVWNPVNHFDHVSFSVYIDVPGKEGIAALPNQNASAPNGMKWDYMVLVGGWVNAFYSAAGASATELGKSIAPAAEVSVDKEDRSIHLVLSPESLGDLMSTGGISFYVTTWDYDGGYRPLTEMKEQWKFSGGDGATSPLILDDASITLP